VQALSDPAAGHVAITGAGVQARSHLRVLEALGHLDVVVWARRPEALADLVAWAGVQTPAVRLRTAADPAGAVTGAAVVVTALSIGLTGAHLDPGWVREDALLLPLDYASSVGPDLAASALLAADDVTQFEAVRAQRKLGDYPQPTLWTGALLGPPRPPGRIVCQNLGNGLSDLVIADAVWREAVASGVGQVVDGSGT
jgi:ornithine cyclodeaminase/alanine dehydrogenase